MDLKITNIKTPQKIRLTVAALCAFPNLTQQVRAWMAPLATQDIAALRQLLGKLQVKMKYAKAPLLLPEVQDLRPTVVI